MKVLRVIANIIIGIILFSLIFCLSLVKTTKNFLEKDLILGVIRTAIVETVNHEANNIANSKEELLNQIFKDNEINDFVDIVIDNFQSYQDNKINFKVSDIDIEKISSYAKKYKNQIIQLSSEKVRDITDEEFDAMFSSENINKFANKIFEEISINVGSNIDIAVEVYDKVTSNRVAWILIGSVIFFTTILVLINWSVYRWMLVPGICLIISGVLMSLVFLSGVVLNDIISSSKYIKEAIGYINFNNYIIVGAIEIVVGVILIIVYNTLKNKKFNEQIDDLGKIDNI